MIHPDLKDALVRAAADLGALQVPWALIGGLAVTFRTIPRLTHDVDLSIVVSGDAEAESIIREFFSRGYSQLEDGVFQQRDGDRLVGIRLLAPGMDEGIVDLLFYASGIEREVVDAADRQEVRPGVSAPIAKIGHLIALKVLAVTENPDRPNDAADLQQLLNQADTTEINRAREAVDLIARRLQRPGPDLSAELARWERKFR